MSIVLKVSFFPKNNVLTLWKALLFSKSHFVRQYAAIKTQGACLFEHLQNDHFDTSDHKANLFLGWDKDEQTWCRTTKSNVWVSVFGEKRQH